MNFKSLNGATNCGRIFHFNLFSNRINHSALTNGKKFHSGLMLYRPMNNNADASSEATVLSLDGSFTESVIDYPNQSYISRSDDGNLYINSRYADCQISNRNFLQTVQSELESRSAPFDKEFFDDSVGPLTELKNSSVENLKDDYIVLHRGFCKHRPLWEMETEQMNYVVQNEEEVIVSSNQIPVCERLMSLDKALFDQADHCMENFNNFQSPTGARGNTVSTLIKGANCLKSKILENNSHFPVQQAERIELIQKNIGQDLIEPEKVSHLTPDQLLNIKTPDKVQYPTTGIDTSFVFDNFSPKLNSKGVNDFLQRELKAYEEAWANSNIVAHMRNVCGEVSQFDYFHLKTEKDFVPYHEVLANSIENGSGTLFGPGDVKLLKEVILDWMGNGDIIFDLNSVNQILYGFSQELSNPFDWDFLICVGEYTGNVNIILPVLRVLLHLNVVFKDYDVFNSLKPNHMYPYPVQYLWNRYPFFVFQMFKRKNNCEILDHTSNFNVGKIFNDTYLRALKAHKIDSSKSFLGSAFTIFTGNRNFKN